MKLTSPLHAFIIASAGIHTGFIMMSGSTDITLPGSTGSAISVKLEQKKQKSAHSGVKQLQAKKINNLVEPETKTLNKTVKKTQSPPTPPTLSEKNKSISKARVVSLIYKELSNHFTYPKIAQRRNWQGQVLLAFRLSYNGTIEDIKINHSSGYNVLDQAAIVSLKKIGQLPQASSWLINGMEIQIPIIYQLTQG